MIFQKHPPRRYLDALVLIDQDMQQIHDHSCRETEAAQILRTQHRLIIENHNLDVKQSFSIKYEPDTKAVAICDARSGGDCDGGKPITMKPFPARQLYWQGIRKQIDTFLCWESSEEPDFNLQVHIVSEAFSAGPDSAPLSDYGIRRTMTYYVRKEEQC